jgi:hypothetical protein
MHVGIALDGRKIKQDKSTTRAFFSFRLEESNTKFLHVLLSLFFFWAKVLQDPSFRLYIHLHYVGIV